MESTTKDAVKITVVLVVIFLILYIIPTLPPIAALLE